MNREPISGEDPAPLLSALHQAQAQEGVLAKETLRSLADSLRVPIADLYGAPVPVTASKKKAEASSESSADSEV